MSLVLWSLGCGSGGIPADVTFSQFDARCSSEDADHCDISGHARPLHLGLLKGENQDVCINRILAGGSEFFSQFAASGETTTEISVDHLRGTVESWVDSENNEITTLLSGKYTVCGYIDVDEDGLLSDGDPVAIQLIDISDLSPLINNWSD